MTTQRLILVAILAALVLGLTAIDKRDEQSCKDRWQRWVLTGGLSRGDGGPARSCKGFLPW